MCGGVGRGWAPWSGGERSEPERKGARARTRGNAVLAVESIWAGPTHNGLFPGLGDLARFFLNSGVRAPAGGD
jgi:hypothetical protein